MTEEQKATAKSVWITLAPYLGVVILDIGLCGLLVASGKELTVEAIIAITGCVGALLFLHKKGGSSILPGGTLLIVASLFMGCAALTGCTAIQQRIEERRGDPCQFEKTVVDQLKAGLDAAEELLDMDDAETYHAIRVARGAHAVGAAAVESCELTRDKVGWLAWVIWALEFAGDIASRFGAAGPDTPEDPPDELMHAIDLLEAEYR